MKQTNNQLEDRQTKEEIQREYYSSNLLPELFYHPLGYFYRRKEDSTGVSIGAEIVPTHSHLLRIGATCNNKLFTIKANKAAFILFTNSMPDKDIVLYPKNLDDFDYSLKNLGSIPKENYRELKQALHNLNHALSINPHPRDRWHYVVKYKDEVNKVKVFQDVVSAKRFYRSLLLKYTKTVSKYCI